jgi:hypothetical protein
MNTPPLGLVVWDADARAVGFVYPLTGEVVDAADPAQVAAWYLAYRDFLDTVARPAAAAALDLLNAHLDYQGAAKAQIDLGDGHVVEISGETASAAASAVVVESAEALRADLDVLVDRGDLAEQAAEQAVKVETVTTYKADLRRVKTLAARQDVVGETVRDHLTGAPRERRPPTVKRVA